ncbi:MAG TPA: heme ABC exporter ATP-binding protein CcmA [Vulgatibacter sp.]|nr:heme ABC exporter ATP-binding protein CcmA [Vulgatibacter sp.]
MDASTPAIEAKGLCRRFGRAWALAGVDLHIPAGKAVIVAGRNGSGKSTLLRVLAGALRPDRGSLRVFGEEALRDRETLRRQVGLLAHASYTYDSLSALQNLQVAARMLGIPADRKSLLPPLEEVGLAHRADDPIHGYSAGMRRRLAFARLLLQSPSIVLLDEPYAQLDPPGFRFVDRLILRLLGEGRTVLVASHHLEECAKVGDLGVVLEAGRVAWSGDAARLPLEVVDPAQAAREAV